MLFDSLTIERHTVTIHAVTTTEDPYGDSTDDPTDREASGLLFAPEGLVESAGSAAPNVVGSATLYGNTGSLKASDTIEHAAPCCSGDSFPFGVWNVVGGSKGWGGSNYAVPIDRAAAS